MSRTYANPVIPGFHPDPSICRVGEDYYLVTSSFAYFPGIPIFHSRDLVNWHQLGHVLTRESQLPLSGANRDFGFLGRCLNSLGIWAPTIRWHDGRFYVVSTNMSHGGHFVVWSTDAGGPWSEPLWIDAPGIDPSLFFGEDGRVYLTANSWPHGPTGLWLSEISLATGRLITPPHIVWQGMGAKSPEGPHLFRRGTYYYMLAAEGGTEAGHLVSVARSVDLWGPYESCPNNPILSHRSLDQPIQSTGHGDMVKAHDGSWWLVFLGTRPGGYPPCHLLGRETFLAPVSWKDGWPLVNDGLPVGLVMTLPRWESTPQPGPAAHDDFDALQLSPVWNFMRNPDPNSWSLSDRPGFLRLRCRTESLDEKLGSPSLLVRRQDARELTVETLVDFIPANDNDEAGLVAYMNESHYVSLALVKSSEGRRWRWHRRVGDLNLVDLGSLLPEGPTRLRLDCAADAYRFSLVIDDDYSLVGSLPSYLLSTEVAGGFTGVFIGMFATSRGTRTETPADFDWFRVRRS